MILFHQKNAGTKQGVNTEMAHSSQPDVNVYCVGCSEDTVTGTKKILLLRCRIIPTVMATLHPPQTSKHASKKAEKYCFTRGGMTSYNYGDLV